MVELLDFVQQITCLNYGVSIMSEFYGYFPPWIRECLTKALLWADAYPQTSHLYGFSPVWIRECSTKLLLWADE